MDPIFEHPVFDSARQKFKPVIRQLVKHKKPLKTRCTLISSVGATRYSLSQNKLGLLMREQLSSIVNEVIRTIYFYFFMKRSIHPNKTLKTTYTLKTQGYLYTFYASSCFFKDLSTNIKNKVP